MHIPDTPIWSYRTREQHFQHVNVSESSPEPLTGSKRWGIGNTCKAVLDSGEALHFIENDKPHTSSSACLIPIEQEQAMQEAERDSSALTVIGTVPSDYQSLAQRLTQLEELFERWLDQVTNGVLGKMPKLQDVENAIVSITLTKLPNLYRDPLHLVLLAIEEPALATWRSDHYDALVEANGENITAILLLWCALHAHVSEKLHLRWQHHQRAANEERTCTCTTHAAQCEEGPRLLEEKRRAWNAWGRVSGTPRADYGFREDYLEAKAAYNEHVLQTQARNGSAPG